MQRVRAILILVGVWLGATTALAQGMIFKWIDGGGNLHVTDRLGDVPEPYYAMYAARLKALAAERAKKGESPATPPTTPTPDVAPPPPDAQPQPSLVDQEIRRQQEWRGLVAKWRGELAAATNEVEAIQNELDAAQLNPILRETPSVKDQAAEIKHRRHAALEHLETARKMLLVELPARAHRENVPPRWLE